MLNVLYVRRARASTAKQKTALQLHQNNSIVTWIPFRASSFADAWTIVQALVTFQHGIVQMFSWSFIGYAILIVATVLAVRKSGEYDLTKVNGYYPIFDLSTFKGQFVLFLVIGLILGLAYTGENPFVYFQF